MSPAGKTGLEKEQEFIRKCMESLLMASANLEKDAHSSLTSIERGLLMLKTHLEAFRRRYTHLECLHYEKLSGQNHFIWEKKKKANKQYCSTSFRLWSVAGLLTTCDSGRSRGRESAATLKLWVTNSLYLLGSSVSPPACLTRWHFIKSK